MRYDWLPLMMSKDDSDFYWDNIPWQSFPYRKGYTSHYISEMDILRPWNIPYRYRFPVHYDDIILKINGILDLDNVSTGTEIRIPNKQELDTWLNQWNPER